MWEKGAERLWDRRLSRTGELSSGHSSLRPGPWRLGSREKCDPSVLPWQEQQDVQTRDGEQDSGDRHGGGGHSKEKIRVKGEAQLCLP